MMATPRANLELHATVEEGRGSRQFNSRHGLLLWSAALIGVGFSATLFWYLSAQEHQMIVAQFKLDAEKKVETIKHTIDDQLSVMGLLKSFYAGSLDVQQSEFKTFSVSIFENHPDIKSLAWIPRVRAEQRGAHEAEGKEMGFPEYQIRELGRGGFVSAVEREEYFPLLFVEPVKKYQGLLGFNVGSLPEQLAALRSAESGKSPAMAYAQIPGMNNRSPLLLYIYEAAQTEATASANPLKVTGQAGFILGVYELQAIISKALELLQPVGADTYLFDITDPQKPETIIAYPSRIRVTPLPALAAPPGESPSAMYYQESFLMADRTWLVCCLPTDVYMQGKRHWGSTAAMFAGLLITGLVVGYLFLLTGRTQQIEKLVAQRTNELVASEKRFRLLVDNAADGFFLIDDEGRVLDVNQRGCEILGYSREELLKMYVLDFEVGFKPEEHHELTWKRSAADFPINVDGVHRRKDGSTYPAEIRLNCLDTGGKRLIMAVVRDVTERRQAEEALQKERQFLRHLIDLQERDRKLVACEIHDGLAQQLTAAGFKLQSLKMALEKADPEKSRELLKDTLHLVRKSVEEARRLIGGLRPPILDELGIIAALEYLISEVNQSGGLEIEFAHQVQFHRLASLLEVALFRIAQESLHNACRYSQSPKIRLELTQMKNRVRLTVQDWGLGFDPQKVKGERFGLRGIRERVRLLGGVAEINSAPGAGATIAVELPLSEEDIDDRDGESE